jgi:beta-glucosidase
MNKLRLSKIWIVLLVVSASSIGIRAADPPKRENPAIKPASRANDFWQKRHAAMNERVKKGDVDLLFIGDSITQAWEDAGKDVWEKNYAKRKAVNLGISGDSTQAVLWRLDNGNIDGIKPKAAVIMIGTNNSNGEDYSVAEIAEGITAIVKKLRDRLPDTQILLLGIFPRGEQPNSVRGKVLQVNQIIQNLDDKKHVHFLDIGHRFVNADGSISKDIMPDFLHLTTKGYEIWADAIEKKLTKLMGEK